MLNYLTNIEIYLSALLACKKAFKDLMKVLKDHTAVLNNLKEAIKYIREN
jgi:hypothetical protein